MKKFIAEYRSYTNMPWYSKLLFTLEQWWYTRSWVVRNNGR